MQPTHIQSAIDLIQVEYAGMPDLKLTFWQAHRLWNFSDEVCAQALTTLTGSGFLVRNDDGEYVRRTSSVRAVEKIRALIRAV